MRFPKEHLNAINHKGGNLWLRGYKRMAVKVVGVYANGSTVIRAQGQIYELSHQDGLMGSVSIHGSTKVPANRNVANGTKASAGEHPP